VGFCPAPPSTLRQIAVGAVALAIGGA